MSVSGYPYSRLEWKSYNKEQKEEYYNRFLIWVAENPNSSMSKTWNRMISGGEQITSRIAWRWIASLFFPFIIMAIAGYLFPWWVAMSFACLFGIPLYGLAIWSFIDYAADGALLDNLYQYRQSKK